MPDRHTIDPWNAYRDQTIWPIERLEAWVRLIDTRLPGETDAGILARGQLARSCAKAELERRLFAFLAEHKWEVMT